jgi:hypothetical protein
MYLAISTTASERKSAGLPATAIQSDAREGIVVIFQLRVFSSSAWLPALNVPTLFAFAKQLRTLPVIRFCFVFFFSLPRN